MGTSASWIKGSAQALTPRPNRVRHFHEPCKAGSRRDELEGPKSGSRRLRSGPPPRTVPPHSAFRTRSGPDLRGSGRPPALQEWAAIHGQVGTAEHEPSPPRDLVGPSVRFLPSILPHARRRRARPNGPRSSSPPPRESRTRPSALPPPLRSTVARRSTLSPTSSPKSSSRSSSARPRPTPFPGNHGLTSQV